jgi:hypothetical protein
MVKLIEAELESTIKIRVAGNFTLSILGYFSPMIKETQEMLYTWEEAYLVDHTKFETAFGADVTSHELAIKETVAWFKKYLEVKK